MTFRHGLDDVPSVLSMTFRHEIVALFLP